MLHPERRINKPQQDFFLTTVVRHPPELYAGLVASMVAHSPEDRPSLEDCFNVVIGKLYEWRKVQRPATKLTRGLCSVEELPKGPPRLPALKRQRAKPRATAAPLVPKNTALLNLPKRNLATPPVRQAYHRIIVTGTAEARSPPLRQEHIFAHLTEQNQQSDREVIEPTIASPKPIARPQITKTNVTHNGVRRSRRSKERGQKSLAVAKATETSAEHSSIGNAHRIAPAGQRQHPDSSRPRQTLPPIIEPHRNKISKPHRHDTHALRQLRRHPARAQMVYRLTALCQRKDQLCRGLSKLYNVLRLAADGVIDSVTGACGIPMELYSLFKDVGKANEALRYIAPEPGLGLPLERRSIYGLKPNSIRRLELEDYDRERYESYLLSSRGRRWLETSRARQIKELREKLPEPTRKKVTFQDGVKE